MYLWIDDLRPAPDGWKHVTSSSQAINTLEWAKMMGVQLEAISFDHDLGGDDTTRPVVLWCCMNDWWPKSVYVHSSNQVGCDYLRGMVERYAPEGTYKR